MADSQAVCTFWQDNMIWYRLAVLGVLLGRVFVCRYACFVLWGRRLCTVGTQALYYGDAGALQSLASGRE